MMRSGKAVVMMLAVVVSGAAWAGASSTSSLGGGGSRIDKINRHALKSAVLVRQLLVKNGVAGVAAGK